jgi:hypothetical protein
MLALSKGPNTVGVFHSVPEDVSCYRQEPNRSSLVVHAVVESLYWLSYHGFWKEIQETDIKSEWQLSDMLLFNHELRPVIRDSFSARGSQATTLSPLQAGINT